MRAAALVLALLAAPSVDAQSLAVPPLTGRVVDLAEVLSPSTEAAITARLAAHEDSTSNQIAVLTIPSLEGAILEEYATDVFRTWGLGQADRDNGVLLLVAVGDRELRIEVGYGLEGALTDATAGSIIRNEITPRFRDSDFDAGVLAGAESIVKAVDGEYVTSDSGGIEDMGWGERMVVGLLMILFPLLGTVTPIVVSGATGTKGDLSAGFIGVVGGIFTGVGLYILTLSGYVALAVVLAAPVLLILLNRWLERHPTWGPKRRHNRAKQAAFAKARKRGAKTVIVDGRSYSVPVASSSSGGGGGFSGGGGSSGGGGASGGW
ncbi:TPM domain-containing protein [Rubrivirga sp. IMCC43871]|uniref:TPM domain-containing protein n=1 Tax=Rubrivirga sp. IMCC43871 TaxID=3391575 RepID=UPI003990383A